MRIEPAGLDGVFLIQPDWHRDARGQFARLFDHRQFAAAGLVAQFDNASASVSRLRHTLRGMHLQLAPAREAKLVRCVRGALFDVALDLRPHSARFGAWAGHALSAENGAMLYVPEGFAHGFLTLADDTEALYLTSAFHDPARERGVRWDDPRFAIGWPAPPSVLSDKDRAWPDYAAAHFA